MTNTFYVSVKTASAFPPRSQAFAKLPPEQVIVAAPDQQINQQLSITSPEFIGGNVSIEANNLVSPLLNLSEETSGRTPRVIGYTHILLNKSFL